VELGSLPPYNPDGTLPPLPEEPVDGEWLRRRYRLSKAAFHNRKNALPAVKGVRRGKRVLFTPDEVYLFDACDWYVDQGYTLDEVLEAQRGFVTANLSAEEEAEEAAIEQLDTGSRNNLALSPQADKFARDLAAVVAKAVEQLAPRPPSDPLRTLRLLDEAAKNDYVLTTRWLADILEFSVDTVHSFKSPELRHGFELTKVAPGKWVVRRLEKDELSDS
jgi:hypothetical protein